MLRVVAIASLLAFFGGGALAIERIGSNVKGPGRFQLGGGTTLVLGRNASIVLDRNVTGGGGTAKTVSLRIVSGSVRFLSGVSDKKAYKISTPQGTVSIRGTSLDLTVRDNRTSILLLPKNSR